jgi:uncharacterized protein (DUF3820 family)
MNYKTFPFGKYKGYILDEIPTNYIVYAIEQMDLPDELTDEFKLILIDRLDIDLIYVDIKKYYREMCKKYHPDTGGSDYAMQIINEFYNLIK